MRLRLENELMAVVFEDAGPGRISLIDRRSRARWTTPECTALIGAYEAGYERIDAEAAVPNLGVKLRFRRTGPTRVECL